MGNHTSSFDGIAVDLGNVFRPSGAQSRSIGPENRTGAKGRGEMATFGEGEIKFYLDGDLRPGQGVAEEGGEDPGFPTVCGTGTEDYFCGSYNFDAGAQPADGGKPGYREFTTPYAGMPQVLRPDGLYRSQQRFGRYRWHTPDPIRFEREPKVTIQALGWRNAEKNASRYLPLQDDIASVAYWCQALPSARFPALPGKDELAVL